MISQDYLRMMARYNKWQNGSLYGAASGLDDAARRAERGAFFGSIHGTLAHLLWGDLMWMSRFDGVTPPDAGIRESSSWIGDWETLAARRQEADAMILDWAGRTPDGALAGEVTWHALALERVVTRPMDVCVAHFFNHQTHHRGQVHAMLTAAGAKPGATDLSVLPEEV